MGNKRVQLGDRRHNGDMPSVPFKDSHGATIKECRRKIPDRRIGKAHTERKKHTPRGLMRTLLAKPVSDPNYRE